MQEPVSYQMAEDKAENPEDGTAGKAGELTPEALFARYSKMVYNLALKLTGNPQAAEDVSQDAFLKAMRGLAIAGIIFDEQQVNGF